MCGMCCAIWVCMTTIDNVTQAQIEQLRTEAAEAGDMAQVALCTAALKYLRESDGAPRSNRDLAKCVRAIQSAEAMAAEA